ncbi:MAG: hypothetical protein KKA84_06890 [Bacteroidetes bacterium]|nr:hypothetical protein [Bacteroidota bacterium]
MFLKKILTTVIIFVSLIGILSCQKKTITEPDTDSLTETGIITDAEDNSYNTVKIGDQWWMAENLKSKITSDGTNVSGVYIYNNDENFLNEYGRLYTWEAAQKPFIEGWHLPSEAEWAILARTLGSDVAVKLKVGGSSGFEAKFGGYRTYTGQYVEMGSWGGFWTSTVYTSDHSYIRYLFSFNNNFPDHEGCGNIGGNSVRLIKD